MFKCILWLGNKYKNERGGVRVQAWKGWEKERESKTRVVAYKLGFIPY